MIKVKKKFLVTGCAGFIGFHFSLKLISKGHLVYGIDNMNKYYDVELKKKRLSILKRKKQKFKFFKNDINDAKLKEIFLKNKFEKVFHFAAQAGVRYSFENPQAYYKSNIEGLKNLIFLSKKYKIKHFVFASSSSVYGDSKRFPVTENFSTRNQRSLYASTKKNGEIMLHTCSELDKLPVTCLRFFTVYGPYGRPDMALFKFVKNILNNKNIEIFNNGKHQRDFTYIDDVVKMSYFASKEYPKGKIPFSIFNICGSKPRKLTTFIKIIEDLLNIKAKKRMLPFQKGDVLKTYGSNKKILRKIRFTPTPLEKGISEFIKWYKKFYDKKI